jgi:hypothetical protein
MPFKSDSQRKWMFANEPAMAHRWADETPNMKDLPEKIGTIKKAVHRIKRARLK